MKCYRGMNQRKVVARLERSGALILYDFEWSDGYYKRAWRIVRILKQIKMFILNNNIEHVKLLQWHNWDDRAIRGPSASKANDELLAIVEYACNLDALVLSGVPVTDVGLRHLAGLKKLRILYLLDLNVTESGLAAIANLKGLRELALSGDPITDLGLSHLQGLTELRTLILWRNTKMQNSGLNYILKLSNLEELTLSGRQIDDEGLVGLGQLKALRKLILIQTGVSARGIEKLRDAIPGLLVKLS